MNVPNVVLQMLSPKVVVRAHCDLPCGVYDPEQARIEAESCYKIVEKYAANEDVAYRTRAIHIWQATKQVSKVKASTDIADAKRLLELIDEVDAAWKATGGNEKTRVAGRPS